MIGFVLLGISNNPYSISLWVYPFSNNGSTLVHLSTTINGQGWCVDLLGFSSYGKIIPTGWNSLQHQQVFGPILSTYVWTHIVAIYSLTNGVRLYVNGTFIGTTGPMIYSASGQVNILTLVNPIQGNNRGTCQSQSIIPNVYYGSIDEFRVYSRELNTVDISMLANP